MVNITWLFLEMCGVTAYFFHIVSCADHELPTFCSEQSCLTIVNTEGDLCELHIELEFIRSKEKYIVTEDMPPDRRRKIVANLVKAVQRCKKKHLNREGYLQTLCKDRESKQNVKNSRTPEEKKAADQAGNERSQKARDDRTPEEKKVARLAGRQSKKRAFDAMTPEEKEAFRVSKNSNKKKKAGPQDSFARSLVDELAQHRINGLDGSASRPRDLRLALPDSDSSDTGDESASDDEDPEDESVASCDSDGDILMVKAVKKKRQLKKVIKSTTAGVPEDELLSLEKADELDAGVSFLPLDLENSSRIEAEIKDALAYVYTDLVCTSST
jgi:hypothetical protein